MSNRPNDVVTGRLCGFSTRNYDGFTDDKGQAQPGGTTRFLYVSTDFEDEPVRVKVPVKHVEIFGQVTGAGFGAQVRLECGLYAKARGVFERVLSDGEVVEAGERPRSRRSQPLQATAA